MRPSPYARRHPLRAAEDPVGLSAPGFVGRERELAALASALARPPAVVLVEGEAGIGKSRLLREWLASPPAGRHRSLVAACAPLPEPLTLSPIVDAVRHARETVAGLRLSALAGALRPLFPEWAAQLPPPPEPLDDPRAARHRLFRALHEVIDGLGVSLLVVEDLHWADRATLEFLLFVLSRWRAGPGLSLVLTYRREDLPVESLVLRLSARPPVDTTPARLTLPPLNLDDASRLISSMLDGEPLSEEFATFLYEHTDGVPLAVEESVRLLHDRDDVVRHDGQWVRRSLDELQVPPAVRDSVLERVRRLGREAQLVVQVASVVVEAVDEAVVRRVAGLSATRVRAGLHHALAAGVLQEDNQGHVTFRHALMARAVYEAIPGPERRRLHRAAGTALECTDPPPVAQLARHFREAHEVERWCRYAELSADLAIASNDHTVAARLLNEILTTTDIAGPTLARLARRLGAAALYRREAVDDLHQRVIDTLRAVLDAGGLSREEEAEIRNPLGRLLMQRGAFEAGADELERAVPYLSHAPPDAAKAMMALAHPFAGFRPATVHLQWLQRAVAVDPGALTPIDRLHLAVDRASVLLFLGDEEGWALAAELPSNPPARRARSQVARGFGNVGGAALVWGRYPEARRYLESGLALADAEAFAGTGYGIRVMLAKLDWFTGAWDGLAERLDVLASEGESGMANSDALLIGGWLRAARGGGREAEAQLGVILREAQRHSVVNLALEPAAGLGLMRLAEGDVDAAVRVTDWTVRGVQAKGVWVWATDIAPVRTAVLVAAGQLEEASRLVTMFARGLRGRNAPAPRAALAACRAILIEGVGQPDRAAPAFARAARGWQRLPRPYDALLARERQAHCLLASGRPQDALTLLSEVLRGLNELGASGDADRVAHHLRRHGVPVARPWRGGRRGYGRQLSPRELEVVALVVTGCTNREIARALSRSPKTVSTQLNSAMRKFGVSSRTALAVKAVEAGVGLDEGRPAGAARPAPPADGGELSVT